MSAEEKTAAALKELQDRNAELSQQILISQHTAQYVAMGYDNTQAAAAAKALAEGDLKTVFELQTAFNASREKSIRAEAMKRMNAPTGGGTEETESANVTLARRWAARRRLLPRQRLRLWMRTGSSKGEQTV